MDIETILTIIASIVSILGFIYLLLVGSTPITQILPSILINPRSKKIALIISLLGLMTVIFILIVIPKSKMIEWRTIDTGPQNNADQFTDQGFVLRYNTKLDSYSQETLLLSEIFPTTLAQDNTGRNIKYYVGTYGSGIYMSEELPNWKSIGLEKTFVTQIEIITSSNLIYASTNLGIFVTSDSGLSWEHLGPFKGLVTDMAIDPYQNSTILAGTLNGIYRSIDGGISWRGPTLYESKIFTIKYSPSNHQKAYASALTGKIFKSDDGGESWTLIYEGEKEGSIPLAIDPVLPDVMYAGPSDLGLFRSSDAGMSWQYIGLQGTSISSIAVSSESEGLIFVGSDNGNGISITSDGGKTWRNYGTIGDQILDIIEDFQGSSGIIIASKRSGILTSSDFGKTWRSIGFWQPTMLSSVGVNNITTLDDQPDHLLAISLSGELLESIDGGVTWFFNSGLNDYQYYYFNDIYINKNQPNHIILSAYGGVVLESFDRGKTWISISSNLPREGYAPITLSINGTILSGPGSDGVWKKLADEKVWTPTGLSSYSIGDLWVSNDDKVICAFSESGEFLYSKDSGYSWAIAPLQFKSIAINPDDFSVVIGISEDYSVLRSKDFGESWETIMELKSTNTYGYPEIEVSTEQNSVFYIISEQNLKVTHDYGDTWKEFSLPKIGELTPYKNGKLYLSAYFSIYTSNDDGQSWTMIRNNTIALSNSKKIKLNNGVQITGSESSGILISTDSGKTWKNTSIGPEIEIYELTTINHDNTIEAIALIEEKSEIKIINSFDGKVWNTNSTPCQEGEGFLGNIVKDDGNELWQLICKKPSKLFFYDPLDNEWRSIGIPTKLNVVGARVVSGNQVFLLDQQLSDRYTVHITNNAGKSWYSAMLWSSLHWELNKDLRSDEVLIGTNNEGYLVNYVPSLILSSSVILSAILFSLLAILFIINPPFVGTIWMDLKRVYLWIFRSSKGDLQDLHSSFFWLCCPTILMTDLILIQVAGLSSITSLIFERALSNEIIRYVSNSISKLPVSISTQRGNIFLIFMSFSILIIFILVSLLSFSGKVIKKFQVDQPYKIARKEARKNAIALLFMGSFLLLIIGLLPMSVGDWKQELGFDLITIMSILFFYLCFRIVSLAIDTVSEKINIKYEWLASIYLLSLVLIITFFVILLINLTGHFPISVQRGISYIPLQLFVVANLFIVVIYIWQGKIREKVL